MRGNMCWLQSNISNYKKHLPSISIAFYTTHNIASQVALHFQSANSIPLVPSIQTLMKTIIIASLLLSGSTFFILVSASSTHQPLPFLQTKSTWGLTKKATTTTITTSKLFCYDRITFCTTFNNFHGSIRSIRGGDGPSDDDYSDDDNKENEDVGEEEEEEEEEINSTQDKEQSLDKKTKESLFIYGIRKILLLCCHSSISICKAIMNKSQKDSSTSVPIKLLHSLEEKWIQAIYFFFPSSSVDNDENRQRDDQTTTTTKTSTRKKANKEEDNIGLHLIQTYYTSSSTSSGRKVTTLPLTSSNVTATATGIIRGGSLSDALLEAWNDAKLLLVYIPSKPSNNDVDARCVGAITSPEVTQVVKNYKSGSYLIWSTLADSTEANRAYKRLNVVRTKQKGRNRSPILLVCCPAAQQQQQKLIVTSKTLAQHHCNPPPSAQTLSQWLKALRKRHSKEVAKMKYILREQQLYRERQEGYEESMKSDIQREIDERIKKAEEDAKEQKELERLEERKRYREGLLEGLPLEPPLDGEGVITIGLRFPDGKSGTRRFLSSDGTTKMQSIFHWLEGEFDVEKENVKLMTMTGSKTFTYANDCDSSIGDALTKSSGAKLVALRVIPIPKKDDMEEDAKEAENYASSSP